MCAAAVHNSAKHVFAGVKLLFSRKYLLYTNTGISVIMSCAGDGLQQKYQMVQREIAGWNKRRTRDVGVTGLIFGPMCHFWYIFLDRWFPGNAARVVAKKLIVDQLICSPVVISSFLFVTCYLEGKRNEELKNEMIEKGKTLYLAEWIVWPPAQLVNFTVVPLRYRVLFDSTVSFGFDWYFSAVKYGVPKDIPKDSVCDKKNETPWINVGSHVPFLHMQGDIVQLKQDTYHILSEKWKHRHSLTRYCSGCDSVKSTIESDMTEQCNASLDIAESLEEDSLQ